MAGKSEEEDNRDSCFQERIVSCFIISNTGSNEIKKSYVQTPLFSSQGFIDFNY